MEASTLLEVHLWQRIECVDLAVVVMLVHIRSFNADQPKNIPLLPFKPVRRASERCVHRMSGDRLLHGLVWFS